MQPHFDYACCAWYPNLTKKIKDRIQTTQNKFMHFCFQLDKLKHISHEEFERLNWLPVTYRFKQCVSSIVFKYFNDQCPNYLSGVFNVAAESNIQLRGSFQTVNGQFALSYVGPTFWNKTPETLKRTNNPNAFIHNLKKNFLNEHITLFEPIFNYNHLYFLYLCQYSC